MFTFNVSQFVPKFIMADKNGYALAKAIEAGMQIANDTIQAGVKLLYDIDTMPEWRLDELAKEYNLILYDSTQSIEIKRQWIKDANDFFKKFGTPGYLKQYLEAYFDSVQVIEWWEYNGDPYHFKVNVSGAYSEETEAWCIEAINKAKNLRSYLDGVTFDS